MGRTIALLVGAALMAGCAQRSEPRGDELELAEVTADPEMYDGQQVTVRARYYSSFEVSVLTSGFAESHPPRPVTPVVWVAAGAPPACTEESRGVAWAENVTATGTFRYEPDGGFGHLGAYQMAFEDPRVACA